MSLQEPLRVAVITAVCAGVHLIKLHVSTAECKHGIHKFKLLETEEIMEFICHQEV